MPLHGIFILQTMSNRYASDPFERNTDEATNDIQEEVDKLKFRDSNAQLDEKLAAQIDAQNEFGEIVSKKSSLGKRLYEFLRFHDETLPTYTKGKPRPALDLSVWPDFIKGFHENPTFSSSRIASEGDMPDFDPTDYHLFRSYVVFLSYNEFWDIPLPKCPHCLKNDNVGHDTWYDCIRKVAGLGFVYYVYVRKYRCTRCPSTVHLSLVIFVSTRADLWQLQASRKGDRTFAASAKHVIEGLPDFIQTQLPFFFTARNGLDKPLVNLIARGQVNGQSASDASECIAELQSISNHERMDMYYSFAAWGRAKQSIKDKMSGAQPDNSKVPEFDPNVNTVNFSAAFLILVFLTFIGNFKVI